MGAQAGRGRVRAVGPVSAFAWVLALLLGLAVGGPEASGGTVAGTAPSSAAVPSSIVDRYLSVRPPLGDVTVVDISGESTSRRLLAATLQGIVNRAAARIYLVGARAAEQDQRWIDDYVARGLVHVVAHDTLDQALAAFAGEVSGFVVASYAEPWTINTATTVAAARGGVVATAAEVPTLLGLGLTQLDDHVGRWSDATTAYEDTASAERSHLAYPGLAIEQTGLNAPRDFLVQQGIMVVFTRPSDPDYDRVMALLDGYPPDHPVYGYVADTGAEEVKAIVRLSQQGRFLVPTDTTDNLSFHLAVAATAPRVRLAPDARPVAPCTSDTVNVVVAMTDGDNMVIPEAYQPAADRWGSAQRGTLPLGWGLTPATAVLLPAIWDHYAATATPDDEIVGLVGLGYAAPSLMPDPTAFLTDSATLSASLGMESSWSLDLLLSRPDAAGWAPVDAAASSGWQRSGTLLNYTDFGGPAGFTAPDGSPVLLAQSHDYTAGPDTLAAQITSLLAADPSARPLVSFLPASTWTNSFDGLVAALAPLAAQGVRFLTPRQAFACLAAAEPTTTPAAPPTAVTASTVAPTTPPVAPGAATTGAEPASAVSAEPAFTG